MIQSLHTYGLTTFCLTATHCGIWSASTVVHQAWLSALALVVISGLSASPSHRHIMKLISLHWARSHCWSLCFVQVCIAQDHIVRVHILHTVFSFAHVHRYIPRPLPLPGYIAADTHLAMRCVVLPPRTETDELDKDGSQGAHRRPDPTGRPHNYRGRAQAWGQVRR